MKIEKNTTEQFLKRQALRGMRNHSGHDKDSGQPHTITRSALRTLAIRRLIKKHKLHGQDIEDIYPSEKF